MRYVIDGYNLLYAMGLVHARMGPHGLEKARLALLGRLADSGGAKARRAKREARLVCRASALWERPKARPA